MNIIASIVSGALFFVAIYYPVSRLLTDTLKAPEFLQDVAYFLMASVFIANSPIVDKPYHMVSYFALLDLPRTPDTLAYNMQLLLLSVAMLVYPYTVWKCSYLLGTVWINRTYSNAIFNCAAFFLRQFSILVVSSISVLAFGYGQLYLLHSCSAGEIMTSVHELFAFARIHGLDVLRFCYQTYEGFLLITIAGVFITRFAKRNKTLCLQK